MVSVLADEKVHGKSSNLIKLFFGKCMRSMQTLDCIAKMQHELLITEIPSFKIYKKITRWKKRYKQLLLNDLRLFIYLGHIIVLLIHTCKCNAICILKVHWKRLQPCNVTITDLVLKIFQNYSNSKLCFFVQSIAIIYLVKYIFSVLVISTC